MVKIEWTELDAAAEREGQAIGDRTNKRIQQRHPYNMLDELCSRKQKTTATPTSTSALDSLFKLLRKN